MQAPASQREAEVPVPNEVRALAEVAFDDLHTLPGAIRDMHLGIAGRAFRGVGPAARQVQLIHDAIACGAYHSVAAGASVLGRAADTAITLGGIGEQLELSRTRSGSAVIAGLSGLIGDRLERNRSDLHQPVSIRVQGVRVNLERASLRAAFPDPSPHLVVFLHGLMGTEFYWSFGAQTPDETYGARLARDLGCTSIHLRYNTGLHISQNGRAVANLIESLVRAWPVQVQQIALVGHSMGGLVARSACHQAGEHDLEWVGHVHQLVSLGTPHLGAPLEQLAHQAAAVFELLPETRMLSGLLRRRSAGIRDLRYGSLVDEDWRERDPESLRAVACREVPLLSGATHYFVSATLTRDPAHPLGRMLGDVLVLVPSATGQGRDRRVPLAPEHGHHIGGVHHLALLNHPEVYERLRVWISRSS